MQLYCIPIHAKTKISCIAFSTLKSKQQNKPLSISGKILDCQNTLLFSLEEIVKLPLQENEEVIILAKGFTYSANPPHFYLESSCRTITFSVLEEPKINWFSHFMERTVRVQVVYSQSGSGTNIM